ncbi:CAF17-like 4Fe-4S cluster assembly/insertion protein YgfZ [Yoonia sp. 208BN28-4]|uniref:CAF17-like 4Fe-4S cluster assembly/insertion protein YgfZ n=1 Tax=Yoonia sp. 208BN28-4 TaxID=3126505 RepID=UPI00309F0045
MTDRTVLTLTGADRVDFLQGLVTNDVTRTDTAIVYAALLTPQGKYIADFFVIPQNDRLLIDVATSHAPTLAQRLSMYRLRADVQIDASSISVARGTGTAPDTALPDPRHPDLGWRDYSGQAKSDATDWDALRVQYLIPQTGMELTPDTYILEAGFERLHGIDFKKGCYVGQEIAARMKHKTELKKGLRRVRVEGQATPGDVITSNDRPAGTLHTVSGDHAIAYLRFDRTDAMQTKSASLHLAD